MSSTSNIHGSGITPDLRIKTDGREEPENPFAWAAAANEAHLAVVDLQNLIGGFSGAGWVQTLAVIAPWLGISEDEALRRWARVARWIAPDGFDYQGAIKGLNGLALETLKIRKDNVDLWGSAYQVLSLLGFTRSEINQRVGSEAYYWFDRGYPYPVVLPDPYVDAWREAGIKIGRDPDGIREVLVELGAGKGEKAIDIATANPEGHVIAVDGWGGNIFRQIQKAEEAGLSPEQFQVMVADITKPLPIKPGTVQILASFGTPAIPSKAGVVKRKDSHINRFLTDYYANVLAHLKEGGTFVLHFIPGESYRTRHWRAIQRAVKKQKNRVFIESQKEGKWGSLIILSVHASHCAEVEVKEALAHLKSFFGLERLYGLKNLNEALNRGGRDPQVVPVLASLLESPGSWMIGTRFSILQGAMKILSSLDEAAKPAIPLMIKGLLNFSGYVREEAFHSISKLIPYFSKKDLASLARLSILELIPDARFYALMLLAYSQERAKDYLSAVGWSLQDKNPALNFASLYVMKKMGLTLDPEQTKTIAGFLHHDDFPVCLLAASILMAAPAGDDPALEHTVARLLLRALTRIYIRGPEEGENTIEMRRFEGSSFANVNPMLHHDVYEIRQRLFGTDDPGTRKWEKEFVVLAIPYLLRQRPSFKKAIPDELWKSLCDFCEGLLVGAYMDLEFEEPVPAAVMFLLQSGRTGEILKLARRFLSEGPLELHQQNAVFGRGLALATILGEKALPLLERIRRGELYSIPPPGARGFEQAREILAMRISTAQAIIDKIKQHAATNRVESAPRFSGPARFRPEGAGMGSKPHSWRDWAAMNGRLWMSMDEIRTTYLAEEDAVSPVSHSRTHGTSVFHPGLPFSYRAPRTRMPSVLTRR